MTNMVLRELMADSVAELVDLAVSTVLALVVLRYLLKLFGGGGGMRNPNAPRQGDDLQYRVNLSFEEAVFGVKKEVAYNRESTCSTCSGTGAKSGTSPVTCSRCHGSGVINVDTQTPLGMMRRQVTCDVCHGTGKEIKEPCHTCHGTGHERKTHKYLLRFQQVLKLVNKFACKVKVKQALNGGPYGDLFVIINVLPSKQFERNGSTIYYNMNISFVQAALGDTVEVPTVHGDVEMTIPAGTQTGKTFRLKGKGAPKIAWWRSRRPTCNRQYRNTNQT